MPALLLASALLLGTLLGTAPGTQPGAEAFVQPQEPAATLANALLAGDVDALCKLTPLGFSFDGRQIWSQDEIRNEWLRTLERRPLAGTRLYGIEVLTYDEMVARYGKPPARLSSLNLQVAQVAVVNLGGRALLVFLKKHGDAWTYLGVSD